MVFRICNTNALLATIVPNRFNRYGCREIAQFHHLSLRGVPLPEPLHHPVAFTKPL